MKVSILIPAFNEEKYLPILLQSLKKQTYSDFEVIVCDNGSTDRTSEVAKSFGAKVVFEPKKGPAHARNTAASIAKGDIFLFIDADCYVPPTFVENYVSSTPYDGAFGPVAVYDNGPKKTFLSSLYVFLMKLSLLFGKPLVTGGNLAIKSTTFWSVGGFNPDFVTCEDLDLINKVKSKGKVKFVKSAVVYTSLRRVNSWGVFKFIKFHIINALNFYIFGKSSKNYDIIR